MGVLIDDLITRGTQEPYRMFTSRAEFRLLLREDNADLRLTESGYRYGLVDEDRWRAFEEKRENIELETQRLRNLWLNPRDLDPEQTDRIFGGPLSREARALDLLGRPDVSYAALTSLPKIAPPVSDPKVAEQIEIQVKYAGYINRQHSEIERHRQHEDYALPEDLDYSKVVGLSNEIREKFDRHRPVTLGQAGRIPGVTPAAISLLLIHMKRRRA